MLSRHQNARQTHDIKRANRFFDCEYKCNNVPKRTKLHAERQRQYRETHNNLSAEYMSNYRKRKAQENKTPRAST
jgi:hypothetical protein